MFDSDFVVGFSILLTLVAIAFFTTTQTGRAIFRWLKGSRKSYYIANDPTVPQGTVVYTEEKLRTPYQRMNYVGKRYLSVVEIGRGIFHRRSAIYGNSARYWKITGGAEFSLPGFVCLKNSAGLRVEKALELINTYQSLGEMFDRIAELERDNRKYLSGLGALLMKINLDRQRFRSQAAQEIREDLEVVLDRAPAMPDVHSAVSEWLNTFEARRFESRHGCR